MDTRRTLVIASGLLSFALAHPVIGDIPGATLTDVPNLSMPVHPRSLTAGAYGKIWFFRMKGRRCRTRSAISLLIDM